MKYTVRIVIVAEWSEEPADGFAHKTEAEAQTPAYDGGNPVIMLMSPALMASDSYPEACLKAGIASVNAMRDSENVDLLVNKNKTKHEKETT